MITKLRPRGAQTLHNTVSFSSQGQRLKTKVREI